MVNYKKKYLKYKTKYLIIKGGDSEAKKQLEKEIRKIQKERKELEEMEAKMEKEEAERNEKIKELTASTKKKMEEVEALKNEREAIKAKMEETDPENESCAFDNAEKGSHDWCSLQSKLYDCKKTTEKICDKGERKDMCIWDEDEDACIPKDEEFNNKKIAYKFRDVMKKLKEHLKKEQLNKE